MKLFHIIWIVLWLIDVLNLLHSTSLVSFIKFIQCQRLHLRGVRWTCHCIFVRARIHDRRVLQPIHICFFVFFKLTCLLILLHLYQHLVNIILDLLCQSSLNFSIKTVFLTKFVRQRLRHVLLTSQDHNILWLLITTQIDCNANDFILIIFWSLGVNSLIMLIIGIWNLILCLFLIVSIHNF